MIHDIKKQTKNHVAFGPTQQKPTLKIGKFSANTVFCDLDVLFACSAYSFGNKYVASYLKS